MSERIRELAEQAGYLDKGNNHTAYMNFDHELFAELIIQECLQQVRDEVQYEYDWKLADAVATRVLEHFGIDK